MNNSFLSFSLPNRISSFTPIATQRQLSIGKEAGAIGSLVYSMKNGSVQNISDAVEKRIGVGQILAVGTYQLGFQVLL